MFAVDDRPRVHTQCRCGQTRDKYCYPLLTSPSTSNCQSSWEAFPYKRGLVLCFAIQTREALSIARVRESM